MRRRIARFLGICCLLGCLVLLSGCHGSARPLSTVVVFEDNADIRIPVKVYHPTSGSDLSVDVLVPEGQEIGSVSYDGYSLSGLIGQVNGFDKYTLTLHDVRYPSRIRIGLREQTTFLVRMPDGETISIPDESGRLRPNTPQWDASFASPGTLMIAWETEDGTQVSPGSRVNRSGSTIALTPVCVPCTDSSCLSYEVSSDGITITGVHTDLASLVIPDTIDGLPVICLGQGAVTGLSLDTLVLPCTLRSVEDGAIAGCEIRELCLYDTLTEISEASFEASSVHRLRIIAASSPVWCGTYFDTLPDKVDRLITCTHNRLLLFCGSSARFGWNSPMLSHAFPGYDVVNLGVYAYANMRPYAEILQNLVRPGDVLISSPEMDAIQEQFCATSALSSEWFAMTESNWELLGLLDISEYSGVFDSFRAFQKEKQRMQSRSYTDLPSLYDEDGNRTLSPSYNVYGDYVLYRENNTEGRLFGVKRACYEPDAVSPEALDGLNAVYDELTGRGVRVFFTWSPRSEKSVTDGSTAENIRLTQEKLQSGLHATMLTDVRDALLPAIWFYGTDNHLSTEGAARFTEQLIDRLKPYLEVTP